MKRFLSWARFGVALARACCLYLAVLAPMESDGASPPYRSPFDLAFSPDGHRLATSDHTAGALVLIDTSTWKVVGEVRLRGRPAGVVWSRDGRFVYVAECTAGTVAEVSPAGRITRRLGVGLWPVGLAMAPRSNRLLVADSAAHMVSIVDLGEGREVARVGVRREPYLLAVTPDERTAVVGNRFPSGDASPPSASAVVSLIDLDMAVTAADVRLPPNSTNVHGVSVSPDGTWAYVVHNVGRTSRATERVTSGWINTNALTIIAIREKTRYATLLLDTGGLGSANPWGTALSPDGSWFWVTLSGVHQLGKLDLGDVHRSLREEVPRALGDSPEGRAGEHERIADDLQATYGLGAFVDGRFLRMDLPGKGPRGLAISPSGEQLAVGLYYSGQVLITDPVTASVTRTIPMGDQPEPDAIRRGEEVFHDARRCFQWWLSCATCHPEGRADGLNWDLLNDGTGNAKNTRSLLFAHRTPPMMSLGVRADLEAAADAGFRSLLFTDAGAQDLRDVEAYIRSLAPSGSPSLIDGRMSGRARQGKAIFESPDVGCSTCHPGPLYTDLRLHDVGTRSALDRESRYDTPALIEVWRTAPYLHHGRAGTLREVLIEFNRHDRHGRTTHLREDELDALLEYLRSL